MKHIIIFSALLLVAKQVLSFPPPGKLKKVE